MYLEFNCTNKLQNISCMTVNNSSQHDYSVEIITYMPMHKERPERLVVRSVNLFNLVSGVVVRFPI